MMCQIIHCTDYNLDLIIHVIVIQYENEYNSFSALQTKRKLTKETTDTKKFPPFSKDHSFTTQEKKNFDH